MVQSLQLEFPRLQLHAFNEFLWSLAQALNDFWLMQLEAACEGLALSMKLNVNGLPQYSASRAGGAHYLMLLTLKLLWPCTGAGMLSTLLINKIFCCCPEYVQL